MGKESSQQEAVARFIEIAQQFCTLLEKKHRTKRVFVNRILRATVAVYSAGLELPDVEPEASYDPLGKWWEANRHLPAEEIRRRNPRLREHMKRWKAMTKLAIANLGGEQHYRMIFDPFDADDAPVTASVSNDLAEIYCDLMRGSVTLTDPRQVSVNIIWQWKFDLQSHWGRHAAGALNALHLLAFDKC